MNYYDIAKNAYLSKISLFSILSTEEVYRISQSENPEIRCWVAKALSLDDDNAIACSILCFLSNDDDFLVRIEAVDSLSNFIHHQAYQCLLSAASDSDELVRAYAAYGIACVGKYVAYSDARSFLNKMLEYEKKARVRVGVLEALYILGEQTRLLELLDLFESDNYLVRCSVIHALCDIANCSNCKIITSFVENIDLEVESAAVKSAIKQFCEFVTCLEDGV